MHPVQNQSDPVSWIDHMWIMKMTGLSSNNSSINWHGSPQVVPNPLSGWWSNNWHAIFSYEALAWCKWCMLPGYNRGLSQSIKWTPLKWTPMKYPGVRLGLQLGNISLKLELFSLEISSQWCIWDIVLCTRTPVLDLALPTFWFRVKYSISDLA